MVVTCMTACYWILRVLCSAVFNCNKKHIIVRQIFDLYNEKHLKVSSDRQIYCCLLGNSAHQLLWRCQKFDRKLGKFLCMRSMNLAKTAQNDWRNVGRPSSGGASHVPPFLVIITFSGPVNLGAAVWVCSWCQKRCIAAVFTGGLWYCDLMSCMLPLQHRIDALRFLAGRCRRRQNQGLVLTLDFSVSCNFRFFCQC